jgi:hypothetical protein
MGYAICADTKKSIKPKAEIRNGSAGNRASGSKHSKHRKFKFWSKKLYSVFS